MKCSEIRTYLGALVDGEIKDGALQSKLERHLGACSECRRELEVQRGMKALLARLEPEKTHAVMATRVMQAIKDGGRKRTRLVFRPAYAAVAAALLILLAAGFYAIQQPTAMLQAERAGLYKELPAVDGSEYASSMLPRRMDGVAFSNVSDFVAASHEEAREVMEAEENWSLLLQEIAEDVSAAEGEGLYKELPGDDAGEEDADSEAAGR